MRQEGGSLDQYMSADISNPFANLNLQNQYTNMENTMEDLTINQQQADFQRDMFQQSQANTLSTLRGAAGGSGIAALAQQMAQSGTLASQRAAASIGAQESANQRAAASQAGRLQEMERRGQASVDLSSAQLKGQGDMWSKQMNLNRLGTSLGMDQMEIAAFAQQQNQAQTAFSESASSLVGDVASFADSYGDFRFGNNNDESAEFDDMDSDGIPDYIDSDTLTNEIGPQNQ